MNSDTPAITTSSYATGTYNLTSGVGHELKWESVPANSLAADWIDRTLQDFSQHQQYEPEKETMPNANRRIVQVFIADPNENVPLERSTDATATSTRKESA